MKIEVLGPGCAKCKALEEIVKKAVTKIGGFHEVKKVDDITEIMKYNVLSTPALVVNGTLRSSGKLLSEYEVIEILNDYL